MLNRLVVVAGLLVAANVSASGVARPFATTRSRPLPRQTRDCPTITVDSAGIMRDVAALSDDSMEGRRVGTPGNAMARRLIAARWDALDLRVLPPGRIQPFTLTLPRGSVSGATIVGLLRGASDPDHYIVVSAHYDHLGRAAANGRSMCSAIGADSICNGADDNASGTAGLMALARWFAAHPPQHSMVFVAFDAEELGDLGSKAWVAALPDPLTPATILVDVNLDMVGRNVHRQLFAAGPDQYPKLRPLVEQTIACAGIRLTIGHDGPPSPGDDWTNQSDQGAFNARGIPFVYFGEEDHPDYHRAGDEVDHLMPGFFVASVRAIGDLVTRFDRHPIPR